LDTISLRTYKAGFADFYFVNISVNHRTYKRTTLRSNLYKLINKFFFKDISIEIPGLTHADITAEEKATLIELLSMKEDLKILKRLADCDGHEEFLQELRIWNISKQLTG